MLETPSLKDNELQYFCEVIEDLAGIVLKSTKHDLVKTRLRARLVEVGMKSYAEYQNYLKSLPREHEEWQQFINLLTTNKTDFFREPKHFDHLIKTFLPEWLKTNEKTLKVWSAASSTGEEAYTIAMILDRHLPKGKDFKILATDIDTEALETARNAVFPISKKGEIPAEYQKGCVDFGKDDVKGWFRIKPILKDKVIFKRHNLIEKTAPDADTFDLVFCRNVFIYFAPSSIEFVVRKLHRSTKPNGLLYIGHSESLHSLKHEWQLVAPSVLKKGARK